MVDHCGAGKSTLIKALAGFHTLDAGTIHVHGHELGRDRVAEHSRDAGMRFVHQDLALIPSLRVADNLCSSLRRRRRARGRPPGGRHVDRYGRLDVVFNNAGVSPSATVEETSVEVWREVMDINVTGAFLVAKRAIPELRRSGGGAIVNVGSTYGVLGVPGSAAYALGKAAIISLTRTIALELAPDGIRVNALCSGAVATPLHRLWLDEQADPVEAQRKLVSQHPWGRISTAEERARAALFLATDDSPFVTGHALLADGGYTAGR